MGDLNVCLYSCFRKGAETVFVMGIDRSRNLPPCVGKYLTKMTESVRGLVIETDE